MTISVIICSHNPSPLCWSRCLEHVLSAANQAALAVEIIIVDSASTPALRDRADTRSATRDAAVHYVRMDEPGLAIARAAGFAKATGEIIVFFDDDNLPASDYLRNVTTIFEHAPHIAAVGPGVINVEWEQGCPGWTRAFAGVFQERKVLVLEYGCVPEWQSYYPPGTGLTLRRWVMEAYLARYPAGTGALPDRRGRSLSSGGDSQIVYEAIRAGACAGISPALRLVHFTELRKTSLRYLTRLAYGVHSSGEEAFYASFPERLALSPPPLAGNAEIVAHLVAVLIKSVLRGRVRARAVGFAAYLGTVAGRHRLQQKSIPRVGRVAARILGT
jgi:glycosyltransferase involved in cell wall biosynthesis